MNKDTWKSHCGALYSPTGEFSKLSPRISRPNLRPLLLVSGCGQVSFANGKTSNVSGYLQHSNGNGNGNGYNVVQTLTASKPTTALSGYSLSESQHSLSESHHEQDSLSEDEEDHDGN